MLDIAKLPEDLWRQCGNLAQSSRVVASELGLYGADHMVLAYGPVAQRNQFQSLLYSQREEFNVSLLPIHDLGLCDKIPWPGQVLCHFHWIHDRTREASTQAEADEAVVFWEQLLRRIKQNGHKIIWTVHNVMPHESVWFEQDKIIHQMLADAADSLHVMASDSALLTKPYYTLDESKVFVVQHPTYVGAQPDEVTRTEARDRLLIEPDEFVFLSFGAIMEYKGYGRLMAAYDEVRRISQQKLRLIIAGLPSDSDVVERINAWGKDRPDVLLDMTPVPNTRLQTYFRASDLAVCPYLRTMNSGAAMMAVTFDLPVLGPRSGGFRDIEAMGCGVTFENTNVAALADAMRQAAEGAGPSSNDIARGKDRLAPATISRQFFEQVKNVAS